MSELSREPAQTYQLNVLASALGRFAPPDLDELTIRQSVDMCDQVVEAIHEESQPVVPHTNETLLVEALAFDDKLLNQLEMGRAAIYLPDRIHRAALQTVTDHADTCKSLLSKKAPREIIVDPSSIANSYGLADLWDNADNVLQDEVARWSDFAAHPEVPADLQKKVDLPETKELMKLMWRHVIGVDDYPEVKTYLTDQPDLYHVFWAPLAGTLDYATPRSYDRSIQLSFDLPHNATHLAHLDIMNSESGVMRYDDSMAKRAYFEAATVFSEYRTIEEAQSNADFIDELAAILNPLSISKDALRSWMIRDRGYEFKLRAARYAADVMMLGGESFVDTVQAISKMLDIPPEDAEKEAKKYLPWTGLGAVYSFGYRKLQDTGATTVGEVLTDGDGNAITSWSQKISTQASS